jgi:hypothetical protein
MCSDGARWRLQLRDMGDRIEMRYGVHQSPVGHEWLIHFRHLEHNIEPVIEHVFFRGTRVASDSGVFVVETGFPVWPVNAGIVSKAVDRQTGQVCKSFTWYR